MSETILPSWSGFSLLELCSSFYTSTSGIASAVNYHCHSLDKLRSSSDKERSQVSTPVYFDSLADHIDCCLFTGCDHGFEIHWWWPTRCKSVFGLRKGCWTLSSRGKECTPVIRIQARQNLLSIFINGGRYIKSPYQIRNRCEFCSCQRFIYSSGLWKSGRPTKEQRLLRKVHTNALTTSTVVVCISNDVQCESEEKSELTSQIQRGVGCSIAPCRLKTFRV